MTLRLGAPLGLALLASCAASPPETAARASSRYAFWRPAPVEKAIEPADVVKGSLPSDWRTVDPENLLVIDLAKGGRVAIELAPDFAPVHVANIRALARGGWWTPSSVYRLQENYVAQWGLNESPKPLSPGVVAAPPAEYDRALAGLAVRALGYPDSYAPMAGHAKGWPVGYDPESGRAWLAHCYGMVGVARDDPPDAGTGQELYAVIGQAPRHLDLNIAVVGRVLDGIEQLTAHPRGTEALGFIKNAEDRIAIARIRLASQIPAAERPSYEVMRTDSAAFGAYVTGRANRSANFFVRPAGGVDLCNAMAPARRRS